MTTYVLTCDKYRHLMPGFAYLFNQYYSPHVEVTVGCFAPPPPLPSNFRIVQIAEKEVGAWTDVVRPFFASAPEHFLLLLDDYWLVNFVDHKHIAQLESEVCRGAAKADINGNMRRGMFDPDRPGLLVNQQTSRYRSNLQPAIWSKKYLLKLLRPGRTIWEFERLGQREAMQDGARIVALDLPEDQPVFRFANLYKKGKPAPRHLAKISQTDRRALLDLGYNTLFKE